MPAKVKGRFIEPMLLLSTEQLPEGDEWLYQLKLDGYRGIAYKDGPQLYLRSRNDKDFLARYPSLAEALTVLPPNTVIDGEVVALDSNGRPSFQLLQNHGSSGAPLLYFVFDLMILAGRDLRALPLVERVALLEDKILPKLHEPIRYTSELRAPLADLIASVRKSGLEGLVAKRRSSPYEAGQRSGSWRKMRTLQGQEFVIGGYTVGGRTFDALIFGYYDAGKLIYVARTRNGFTPELREQLGRRFADLEARACPFANLPEPRGGRWGQGLTAAKMRDCRWLKPQLVGAFEFVEWTSDNHLRHSRFVALRDDKRAHDVVRE